MIYYYDLKRDKILFYCIDGEIIYRKPDGREDSIVAYRDINDPDYAWYKDLNAFDDPIAYENNGIVYDFESGKPIFVIEKNHE